MSVTCDGCGQTWPRDPALEVPCPVCGAAVGRACTELHPSGHRLSAAFAHLPPWGHDERDRLAMERVPGYGRCSVARGQLGLFEKLSGAKT